MSGNRHGRDPFDDDRTEFIGRDEPTRSTWSGRDDQPTEFIGRDAGYDPDADFGGGAGGTNRPNRGADETRAVGRDGSGQYWAPLTPEERGVDPRGAAGAAGAGGGLPPRDDREYRDYRDDDRDPRDLRDRRDDRDDGDDGGRGGFGKGATIVAVAAIIAIVILVALMFRFLSGDDSANDPTTATPPPEPSSTTSETVTSEEPTETSDPMRDELDRLREEVDSIRETPPAIPGLGGGEAIEATIPEAAGKSPAEVELALRRAGFGDITILDANGNPTNSLSSLTGTVATVDPPSGSTAMTDQPVTITLQ